ncbi:MAG: hypothetical protein ACFCU3_01640 [Verrucomicrobiales bacterium]
MALSAKLASSTQKKVADSKTPVRKLPDLHDDALREELKELRPGGRSSGWPDMFFGQTTVARKAKLARKGGPARIALSAALLAEKAASRNQAVPGQSTSAQDASTKPVPKPSLAFLAKAERTRPGTIAPATGVKTERTAPELVANAESPETKPLSTGAVPGKVIQPHAPLPRVARPASSAGVPVFPKPISSATPVVGLKPIVVEESADGKAAKKTVRLDEAPTEEVGLPEETTETITKSRRRPRSDNPDQQLLFPEVPKARIVNPDGDETVRSPSEQSKQDRQPPTLGESSSQEDSSARHDSDQETPGAGIPTVKVTRLAEARPFMPSARPDAGEREGKSARVVPVGPSMVKRDIWMSNGEKLSGRIVGERQEALAIEHPVLGAVNVPKQQMANRLVEIFLRNGDRLVGELVKEDRTSVTMEHSGIGLVTIPRTEICNRIANYLLINGDRLVGEVLSESENMVKLKTISLGVVTIPKEGIQRVLQKTF